VDNTNLRPSEISPYKLGADAYGYGFIIKELRASQEESFKRNTHGVSEFGHQNMFRAMNEEDKNLPPWLNREVYRSVENAEGPKFEQVPPTTKEEESELINKYNFEKLDKKIKRASRIQKFKKLI
jgi:hypothetical protein